VPRRPAQLAGVRRRQDRERQPAWQQPVLGQHDAAGRHPLRERLRPDAEHAGQARLDQPHLHAGRPAQADAARVLRRGPQNRARHALPRLRGRDRGRAGSQPERRGGDFEPERDIHAITVNRWNYGYAYELCSTFDPSLYGPVSEQPQVKGRRPFRNVAIANSDSGAFAYTHSAINEAYRAVQDLPG